MTIEEVQKDFADALFTLFDTYPEDYRSGNRGLSLMWTCSFTLSLLLTGQNKLTTMAVMHELEEHIQYREDAERLREALISENIVKNLV